MKLSPVDHEAWGRRLVMNRSLDSFKEYGVESGLTELAKGWNHFIFSRDARNLKFTPKGVSELADAVYSHDPGDNLRDHRLQWNDPERQMSRSERKAWLVGFIEAYTEGLEQHVSSLIPPELEDKLPFFCSIVSAIQRDAESGYDAADFGVQLGGRKKEPPPKIHPTKSKLISRAIAHGKHDADLHWGWQQEGSTHIKHPWAINHPYDWKMSVDEEALYDKVFTKTYLEALSEKLQEFAPPRVWKNAFLICSLFDEMYNQRRRAGSRESNGWGYLQANRDHDVFLTEERRKKDAAAYTARENKRRERNMAPSPTLGIADPRAIFGSPQFQITPGAQAAFEESGEQPAKYLDRHFSGDFGETSGDDRKMNLDNLARAGMVMSVYTLSTGVRFYIITDEGHQVTTVLLPEEY